MEIKFVSTKTDQDIKQSKTDISFKYMTDNLEQLKVVNEVNKYRINDSEFLLKENIINDNGIIPFAHNLKSAEGNSYDHLIVEFDSTQTREEKIAISEIVIKSLKAIEQKYYKNPGKDKNGNERPLQEISLNGKHVAFDLHNDHLHLFVSSYSVNKEVVENYDVLKVNPQSSMSNTSIFDIAINEINENLTEAGYKPFNKIANPNFKTNTTNTIPSVATKEVVADLINEVVNTDNVDIENIKEVMNKNIEDLPKNLDMAIISKNKAIAQKEIEKAYQTILEQTHFVNQLNKSENILVENNKLKASIEQKDALINEKQEQILAIESQKETLNNTIQSLQQNEEQNKILINALNEKVEELDNEIKGLTDDYNNINEEVKEKDIIIKNTNTDLDREKTLNNTLMNRVKEQDLNIEKMKKDIDILTNTIAEKDNKYSVLEQLYNELKENFNKEVQAVKDSFNNKVVELETALNNKVEEVKELTIQLITQNKAVKTFTSLYSEVKNKLVETNKKLDNVVNNISNINIKETLINLTVEQNQFSKALKEIDKAEDSDKMKKLDELRAKFQAGKMSPSDKEQQQIMEQKNKDKNKPK